MQPLKSYLLSGLLFLFSLATWSQSSMPIDSPPTKAQLKALSDTALKAIKETNSISKTLAGINEKLKADSMPKTKSDSVANCGCKPNMEGQVEGAGWILTFLPAFLFIGLLTWLLSSKRLKDFSLKEALSENAYPTIKVDNPQYNSTNLTNTDLVKKENLDELIPPTIEKTYLVSTITGAPPNAITTFEPPPPNPSISRYIAFITSILTLVVVLGVACFYIYHYIRTGCPPELTGLSTLLIALGIGVVPYMVNKVSSAVGKATSDQRD